MTSSGTQRADEEAVASADGARGNGEHDADARAMDAPPEEKPVDAEAATPGETPASTEPSSPVVTEEEVVVPEAEAAPASEGAPAEQAPASARPVLESAPPSVLSVAPAILGDDFTPLPTFWSTRPNRSWMVVGGSAVVIAFLAGALTSRAVQPEPSAELAVSAPVSVSQGPAIISTPVPAPTMALPTSNAPSSTVGPSSGVGSPIGVAASAKLAAPGFNAKAAKAVIDGAGPRLKSCRHAGDPAGLATVMVTFEPAGRVASASVTTPGYAGTRTGECIARRLGELRIPEYSGASVTVKRSVTVR